MTVATTTNKAIATGNGVTTTFPFTFGTLPSADLVVTLFDLLGIEDVQTEGADYTILGEGSEDGGAVVFTVAPPSLYTVLIQRIVPETQPTDIKNQGSFYPRTIERMFDRLVYIIQQISERVAASLTLPPQITGVSTQLPSPEANTLFGWNSDNTAITNFPLSTIATSIVYGDRTYQTFSGTGAQVNFSLSRDPASLGNLDVSIDGVVQVPGTDFSYAGTVLTFSTAPANGAVILVQYNIAVPVGTSLAAASMFTNAGSGAQPRSVQDRLRDTVSAMDFGVAANGVASDSAAFALAVTYAAANNKRILAPAGNYRFTAPLVVPSGVSIIGEGAQAYTGPNNVTAVPGNGTWFHFDHAGIGITVVGGTAASASCVISGIGTRRTHAAPGVGWTPTVYDYDIVVEGVETLIDDVLLLNAYKGVIIRSSGYGRLWTNRLRGQCFLEGINLQQSFDTCRIRDSHFWPYWSQQANVIAWQNANTKVIRIARADNSMISGLFSIYSATGIEIYGTGDGTAYRLRLTDIDNDFTNRGIYVDATSDGASVLLSNYGAFGATGSVTSRGIEIDGVNGRYTFANTDVSLFGLDGIRVDGTGNTLNLCGTQVRYYNQAAVGASAYECAAGSSMQFADRPIANNGGAGPMFGAVASVYKADLGSALASGVTNGSGDYVVTHGLGATPSAVFLSGIGTGSLQYVVSAIAATTFTIRVMDAAGAPVAAQPFNIGWNAKKY